MVIAGEHYLWEYILKDGVGKPVLNKKYLLDFTIDNLVDLEVNNNYVKIQIGSVTEVYSRINPNEEG